MSQMNTYRVTFKNGWSAIIDAECIGDVKAPPGIEGVIVAIELIQKDYIVSSCKVVDSPYTLRNMYTGKLMLLEEGKDPRDVSDNALLVALHNHMSFLECHIYELKEKIKLLEAKPEMDRLASMMDKQLRALCGYIEDGTDTKVTIVQDDATLDWHVIIGLVQGRDNCYTGGTLLQAINMAYEACVKADEDDNKEIAIERN